MATKKNLRAAKTKCKATVPAYAIPADVTEPIGFETIVGATPADDASAATAARVLTALNRAVARRDRRALRALDLAACEILERELVPVRRILGQLEREAKKALATKPPAEVAREIAGIVHEQTGVVIDDDAMDGIRAEVSNHVARARQPRAIVSAVLRGAGYTGDLWAGDRKRKQRRNVKA